MHLAPAITRIAWRPYRRQDLRLQSIFLHGLARSLLFSLRKRGGNSLLEEGRAQELLRNKSKRVRRQAFVLEEPKLLQLPPSSTTVQ